MGDATPGGDCLSALVRCMGLIVAVCLAASLYGSIAEPSCSRTCQSANASLNGSSLAEKLEVDTYVIYAPPARLGGGPQYGLRGDGGAAPGPASVIV